MKKFLITLFVLSVSLLLNGCAEKEDNVSTPKTKIGSIKYTNVTENALVDKKHPNDEFIFFDKLSTMVMALKAGKIDAISIYDCVAQYLAVQDSSFEYAPVEPEISDVFCCAMLAENAALKDEFDRAIAEMTTDGTLVDLTKKYINEVDRGVPPTVVEMPTFYTDAPPIKIGVTGDLPLLDYINPQGKPAGFNAAVLAEISRRVGKNFVLAQIESGSRAEVLISRRVDVVFWAAVPTSGDLPDNFDTPEGVVLTMPYFEDDIVHVTLKK